MKRQHSFMPTVDEARLQTAGRRSRLQIALVALLCALLGTACVTSTVMTEVMRNAGGENLIGQSMKVEFDQGVWNELKAEDRSSMGGAFDSLKTQGWQVGSQDGGRIQTASFDPASVADLEAKGWKVSITATDNGKITMAQWLPNGSETEEATTGLQSITVTIDESDPQITRYKYQADVLVKFEETAPSSGSSGSCGDDVWCQMMAQAVATAEADLQEALKQAGPPKLSVGVRLPGNIESSTVNGSPGGKTSGNQAIWDITIDKNGTHSLEATASGPGAGSINPTTFGVTLACNEEFDDDPGQVICVAASANTPQDAEIEFEWKFDGNAQSEKGRTLELHGVSKGEHTVTVVAIATNMGNLRSDPTSTTFTKTTGADAATATATTETEDDQPTATATTVGGNQAVNPATISFITDNNCGRKGEVAGSVRVISVPNGVDPNNIALTGASAQKVKLKNPFPVYRGQKIQLPSGPGWEIVFIQGEKRTEIKGSGGSYTIPCDDGIAAKIAGGVADKWTDATEKAEGAGVLIENGIDPGEAIEFGEGVVGPAFKEGQKKLLLIPKPPVMALGKSLIFGSAAAAPGDYSVAFSVDAQDPSVTKISAHKGEVIVLHNNAAFEPVLLTESQSVEVTEDGFGPIGAVTDSIGDPPVFEDEVASQAQTQGQDGLNIWMLAIIGGGLALLVIIGTFVIARRKPVPQPVAAQWPAQAPPPPPMQPPAYYGAQPGPPQPPAYAPPGPFECPYPDCVGPVAQGQYFCGTCGRSLDPAAVAAARR